MEKVNQKYVRRHLTGDRNQCPTCGEFFNSTHAFVAHLTGKVATKERRCLTVEEMLVKGFKKTSKDFWVTKGTDDAYWRTYANTTETEDCKVH